MKKAKIFFFGIIFLIVVLFSLSKIDVVKNPAFGQAVLFEAKKSVDTTIDAYGICKTLTNTNDEVVIVETGSLQEWEDFLSNVPSGVTVSDTCFCPVTCVAPPAGPPTLFLTKYSESSIKLDWSAPTGVVLGYNIQRRPRDGTWADVIADTGNKHLTFTNTGLTKNTEYEYQVAAINSTGVGEYSAPKFMYTGHCYETIDSCPTGYTSILGGSQAGCATVGPVSSPYPGDANNRYRILSNAQTLTTTCSGVGTQQRTRQAQVSLDSGATYAFTGPAVNCHSCIRGTTCGTTCTSYCSTNYICGTCSGCNEWCTYGTTPTARCCASYASAWNRTCADQTATIRWCCRN